MEENDTMVNVHQPVLKQIYEKIANEWGYTPSQVEEAFLSVFRDIRDFVRKTDLDNPVTHRRIMLRQFGVFSVKRDRIEKLKIKRNARKQREQEELQSSKLGS
jgi:nucleoid DNA-binding protein